MTTTDPAPAAEMRAAALVLHDALDPLALARLVDGTFVAVCASHDEPALICKGCTWLDAGTPELAALVVALLNARNPLRTWLEWAADQARMNDARAPRHRVDVAEGLATARAITGGDRG